MSCNPHLDSMDSDYLYHLNISITRGNDEIKKRFGDVKFVCMGGTAKRMHEFAEYLRTFLDPTNTEELVDLGASGHRYAMYKVKEVLCCSHGIGMASMSVALHELIKLVRYAGCDDPVFIRLGTCGGIAVEPGTVVVTDKAYNGHLQNVHEIFILGKRVERKAHFNGDVINAVLQCGNMAQDSFVTVRGNTLAAECFYEGQGRLDGASCDYTNEDKMRFLQECEKKGIKNIEMEATMFSSLTLKAGIRAADVCVTILNRLNGDQVTVTPEQKVEWEKRPLQIVGRYIERSLSAVQQ